MSSDRAKISYDENQHYRSVVMQQGRVTLEADWNEQGQILAEETRKEALDFVGPSGTPDDGFAVAKGGTGGAFDLSLSPGILYVGGERVSLDPQQETTDLFYGTQAEWLDNFGNPDWVPVPEAKPATNEYVYLLLREQEISAVEDSALLEVALGGPDSAARTRLIQRIVRTPTTQQDCPSALDALVKGRWQDQGLAFDYDTLRLQSKATLALDFDAPATPSDPCQPQATGGYLGAENQLIRVKISAVDTANKQYKLAWGFDNASYLYSVNEVDTSNELILNAQPADSVHRPVKGQAVEILRSAAKLANGAYVAAADGFVTTLSADYNPDLKSVELTDPLPSPEYPQDPKSYLPSPPLYLRVWQEEVPFVPGVPKVLGGTGLTVTLAPDANGLFHAGDFWHFAVRPGTPTQVYPQRYQNKSPQLPDGPRLWACPLALVDWKIPAPLGVLDCRNHFDSIVELTRRKLGGCCTVTVRPEDITATTSLQSIIDRYKNKDSIIICLMPGVYPLQQPLVFGPEHSNLTLSGCHDGVVLQAAEGLENKNAFLDGLVVLNRANGVSFRRLRFELPQASFGNFGGIYNVLDPKIREALGQASQNLMVSIGVRAVHCALLSFEDCLFRFSLTKGENVWGAGIFANSECWGLSVKSCRFLHEEDYLETRGFGSWRILSGFVLTPAFRQRAGETKTQSITTVVFPLLQDAYFEGNLFSGLTFATFIYSDAGILEYRRNTVRECMAGFFYASLATLAYAGDFNAVGRLVPQDTNRIMTGPLQAIGQDPYFLLGSAIARSLPLPKIFNALHAVEVSTQHPSNKDNQQFVMLQQSLAHMLDAITGKASRAAAATVAPVEAATTAVKVDDATAASVEAPAPTTTTVQVEKTEPQPDAIAQGEATAQPSQQAIDPASVTVAKAVHLNLLAQERLALTLVRQKKHGIDLSLHVVDNDIDAHLGRLDFNFALVALDTYISNESSLIMSGNRLQNHSMQIPTAMVWSIQLCSITGNLIQNQAAEKVPTSPNEPIPPWSLFVSPSVSQGAKSGLAVTGNVLLGSPVWPFSRGFPASAQNTFLDTWYFLNTVI